eukprot:635550-Pelagomonas_calceolata.AAC.5
MLPLSSILITLLAPDVLLRRLLSTLNTDQGVLLVTLMIPIDTFPLSLGEGLDGVSAQGILFTSMQKFCSLPALFSFCFLLLPRHPLHLNAGILFTACSFQGQNLSPHEQNSLGHP